MTTSVSQPGHARALSVTDLASVIQGRLEADFGAVWVVGELSGLRTPASGHMYFTLKDDTSQLRGVMFRGYARLLRFRPEDGLEVLIKGRVSLYSARGDLQVYAASMEPRGLGGQQLALEQLKAKLAAEGLFAPERKRPLPFFPASGRHRDRPRRGGSSGYSDHSARTLPVYPGRRSVHQGAGRRGGC